MKILKNKSSEVNYDQLIDLNKLKKININDFKVESTAIINVDIIKGFYKSGVLASERLEKLIPKTIEVNNKFKNFTKIFFIDTHDSNSLEFKDYPQHCLKESKECDIIEELKEFMDEKSVICHKNSTNGFLSPEYSEWVMKNSKVTNFIILGSCSDICIMQYALTQKAFMNEWGIDGRVIVIVDATDTFNSNETKHNADLMNTMALYNMDINGIELLKI